MIKIFLAEDEFIVREGIKNNIDWASHGYEFCGEASDGELALPMIRKLSPDIVITDIKMPFMDGLELSRHIRQEFPWIEIVILSGYEEFEYAKEGIKIGVAQYLTKPITGEELLREIDIISEKIIQKQQENALKEQFKREMEENDKKDRKEFFHKLVSGQWAASELLAMGHSLGMELAAMYYSMVLIYSKSENHELGEYSGSSVRIDNRINEIIKDSNCLLFDRDLEGVALLFMADSKEELEDSQKMVVDSIVTEMNAYSHIKYFGGIGQVVNRLSNLHLSYDSASHALAHRFFISDNLIMTYEETADAVTAATDNTLDVKQIDAKRIDRRNLVKFLKLGSKDEIPFFVSEFFKNMGDNAIQSSLFRQYIAMDSYFCVVTFIEEIGKENSRNDIVAIEPQMVASVEATMKYVQDICDAAITIRESIANNRYSEIVDETIKYIEENYGDEELSLNSLASHVNVSPNHLSAIFSQQTGQTFIKYLTEYRMEKAKELLRCTGKRSSEISEEVGYKDPHYFSYMFKKSVGMTPTKYRGNKDIEEED